MDYSKYAKVIGRIYYLQTRLLSIERMYGICEAKSYEDAVLMLQDTLYRDYLTGNDYDVALKKCLEDMYSDMYKDISDKNLLDILSLRYDCHNIKALVKGKLWGIDTQGLIIDAGSIRKESLIKCIQENNFKNVDEKIEQIIKGAYKLYENGKESSDIDYYIDSNIYELIHEKSEKSGDDFTKNLITTMFDLINLKSFIRLKLQNRVGNFSNTFINGGSLKFGFYAEFLNEPLEKLFDSITYTAYDSWGKKCHEALMDEEKLQDMEKISDNFLMNYIKKSKYLSSSQGVIISFILSKENEMKILRIIFSGIISKISPDVIKERLRDTYV